MNSDALARVLLSLGTLTAFFAILTRPRSETMMPPRKPASTDPSSALPSDSRHRYASRAQHTFREELVKHVGAEAHRVSMSPVEQAEWFRDLAKAESDYAEAERARERGVSLGTLARIHLTAQDRKLLRDLRILW